ncbi:MAG: hypothetical protein ACRCZZ_04735 [Phocaeicola sp.]
MNAEHHDYESCESVAENIYDFSGFYELDNEEHLSRLVDDVKQSEIYGGLKAYGLI